MRGLIVLFVCFLMGGVTGAFADSESDGRAAEQAGRHREALDHYVAALQAQAPGSAREAELRERIVGVAKNIKPAPAVPQEAQRRLARAQGFIEIAKQPEDYQRPANELRQALKIAPWWAEGYFNLAVVLEKAEKYGDAIASLKLYARAVEGKDAQAAELAIARLEAKAEASSPADKAAREQSTFEKFARSLEGVMFAGPWESSGGQFRAHISNGQIVFGFFDPELLRFNPQFKANFGMLLMFKAALSGYRISFSRPSYCDKPGTAEITPDGRSMRVRQTCSDGSQINTSLRRQ